MSAARFPCEHCLGVKLDPATGLVCATCGGSGTTIPHERTGDALSDWVTRNVVPLVLAFSAAIWFWLGPIRRWAFKDDK